ncbi:E3 ubiquitin-protein ligase SMURF2 [Astathelohania contejeani]|uniref:HECT-type E3 ubiquitin transferase n=1 Tax=Astathelohania contejeani TaxID=164912 RepID=A0ABQ7I0L0_9MICR|nr:E3 ubiquitin-protein ligase SMURF2 [Thelohania contejeani]
MDYNNVNKEIYECQNKLEEIIQYYFQNPNNSSIKMQAKPFVAKDKNWICGYMKVIETLLLTKSCDYIPIDYWRNCLGQLFISEDYKLLQKLYDHFIRLFTLSDKNIKIKSYLKMCFNTNIDFNIYDYINEYELECQKKNASKKNYKYRCNDKEIKIKKNDQEILRTYFHDFIGRMNYNDIFEMIGTLFYNYIEKFSSSSDIIANLPAEYIIVNSGLLELFNGSLENNNLEIIKKQLELFKLLLNAKTCEIYKSLDIDSEHWIIKLIQNSLHGEYTINEIISIIQVFKLMRYTGKNEEMPDVVLFVNFYINEKSIRKKMLKSLNFTKHEFFENLIKMIFLHNYDVNIKHDFYHQTIMNLNCDKTKLELLNAIEMVCSNNLKTIKSYQKSITEDIKFLFELIIFRIKDSEHLLNILKSKYFIFDCLNTEITEIFITNTKKKEYFEHLEKYFITIILQIILNSKHPCHFLINIEISIINQIFNLTETNYGEYFNVFYNRKCQYKKFCKIPQFIYTWTPSMKVNAIKPFIIDINNIFECSFNQMNEERLKEGKFDYHLYNLKFIKNGQYYGSKDTKYWLTVLSEEFKKEELGMLYCENSFFNLYKPKYFEELTQNQKMQNQFRFLGNILGYAIRTGNIINLKFTQPFYKLLLSKKSLNEIRLNISDITKSQMKGLKAPSYLHAIKKKFTQEKNSWKDYTPDNQTYHRLYDEEKKKVTLYESDIHVASIIKKGMVEMIDENILAMLDDTLLAKLLTGDDYISIVDWKLNTVYNGDIKNEKSLLSFWNYIDNLNEKELRNILFITTGLKRLQIGGFSQLIPKFNISINRGKGCELTTDIVTNTLHIPEHYTMSEFENSFKNL